MKIGKEIDTEMDFNLNFNEIDLFFSWNKKMFIGDVWPKLQTIKT